jgi:hypothetical protein
MPARYTFSKVSSIVPPYSKCPSTPTFDTFHPDRRGSQQLALLLGPNASGGSGVLVPRLRLPTGDRNLLRVEPVQQVRRVSDGAITAGLDPVALHGGRGSHGARKHPQGPQRRQRRALAHILKSPRYRNVT